MEDHGREEQKGHKAGAEGGDSPQEGPEDGEEDRGSGSADPDELFFPPSRDQGPSRRRPGGAGGEDPRVGS